jgi:predicted signal transduction protein with EAL and GGDEF domain
LIIIGAIKERHEIASVAEKVVEHISQNAYLNNQGIQVGCSIGISVFPDDARDLVTLMSHADMAMYGV